MSSIDPNRWREWFASDCGRAFLDILRSLNSDCARAWMSIADRDTLYREQGRAVAYGRILAIAESLARPSKNNSTPKAPGPGWEQPWGDARSDA